MSVWLLKILSHQVSDVVPIACPAAAKAGIRSVCVTDFRSMSWFIGISLKLSRKFSFLIILKLWLLQLGLHICRICYGSGTSSPIHCLAGKFTTDIYKLKSNFLNSSIVISSDSWGLFALRVSYTPPWILS